MPLRLGTAPRILQIRGPHQFSEGFGNPASGSISTNSGASSCVRTSSTRDRTRAGTGQTPSTDIYQPAVRKDNRDSSAARAISRLRCASTF